MEKDFPMDKYNFEDYLHPLNRYSIEENHWFELMFDYEDIAVLNKEVSKGLMIDRMRILRNSMSFEVKEMFDHLKSNDELKIVDVSAFLYHLEQHKIPIIFLGCL